MQMMYFRFPDVLRKLFSKYGDSESTGARRIVLERFVKDGHIKAGDLPATLKGDLAK